MTVKGSSFATAQAESVWVEAESLANHGGWMLDTQFIDIMGSPYLLAHGTGAIPRGRPALKAKKSDEFAAQEESCMSG